VDRLAPSICAEVELTWLHRDGREAGTTDLLVDALRRGLTPQPTTYAWGGAESRAMTAVRRHLRHDVGLGRDQVSMTPYWRHASHAGDASTGDESWKRAAGVGPLTPPSTRGRRSVR
jgi:NADPH-dependent ferric siderophore reductase